MRSRGHALRRGAPPRAALARRGLRPAPPRAELRPPPRAPPRALRAPRAGRPPGGPDPRGRMEELLPAGGAAWLLGGFAYPGNTGFAIRTAEVSGADGVFV